MIILFKILFAARRVTRLQRRIVNGMDARIEEFPYLVWISILQGKHFCGGTIIGHKYVLTAAHCIINFKVTEPYQLMVFYGDDISHNSPYPTKFSNVSLETY